MPELPEVETVRRTLKNFIIGKEIKAIRVHYDKIVVGDTDNFVTTLTGQTIRDIDRVGKYLIFVLDHDAFISHLRMEGKYNIVDASKPLNKHEHLSFVFSDGTALRYQDTRKFGRLELVNAEAPIIFRRVKKRRDNLFLSKIINTRGGSFTIQKNRPLKSTQTNKIKSNIGRPCCCPDPARLIIYV